MTGRKRIEAAFTSDGTPHIAAVIPYEGIYVRDRWDEVTGRPWWEAYDPNIENQLRWRRAVIRNLGQDWFALPLGPSRADRESSRIEHRPDGPHLVNDASGSDKLLRPPVTGGWNPWGRVESLCPSDPAQTIDDIDRILAPSGSPEPGEINWHGRDEITRAMLEEFGGSLYTNYSVSSPLWSCYGLWGYELMMTNVATRPELVKHACERYLERSIEGVRAAVSLGADAVWIEECLTDQVNPEAFSSLNVPATRRLVEEIRLRGLKSIYYYCGDPAGKWEHIIAIGADALALEEGKKGFTNDIGQVAEMMRGRCVLFGNIDAVHVLQDGSDETLRAHILRQIEAARANGRRFVMSAGSPVTPGTPVSRVKRYCEMVHELGHL